MINLFPYTDAHELNLDWVVEQVKANNTKVKDLTHTVENLHFDFDSKADKATTYTKSEVDTLLLTKADVTDFNNYYNKGETDSLLAGKADLSDLPDMSDYYDTTTIDSMFNNLTLPFSSITSTPGTLAGYGIINAYTQTEVDLMISGLQGQIDGVKTARNGNFTAASNITIGSRNFWRKQNGFVSMTVVLTVTANIAGGAALLTDNDLTFVNNSYLYARKEDGTIEILTCNGHDIITEFGISSGTVLRIGATIFVQ